MKIKLLLLFLLPVFFITAQNMTDVSLFLRNDSTARLNYVVSKDGDMYQSLGHHGPAIENEWLALRIYFDKKAAIDVYSKKRPGLELREFRWYPDAARQKEGWGADYYKVGTTVGLGGIRLWDGEKVVPLHPVSKRSARVVKEGKTSFMEMLSEGVPCRGGMVDILVRVTVYSGLRMAKVEAFALSDTDVEFVTGINYHPGCEVVVNEKSVFVWGLHPEDVAAEEVEVGAAIFIDPSRFAERIDDGNQHLFLSNPTKYICYWISSANAKEPLVNSLDRFVDFSMLESAWTLPSE